MLALDAGRAMAYLVSELESLGYAWAYRLVDSRFTGTPQRRQRVLLVASKKHDPRDVLLGEDVGEPTDDSATPAAAYGFYWTEGLRGLGWARNAVPTLKGGSSIGIASPPAIWVAASEPGRKFVVPSITDAEALQGFPRGWTEPAEEVDRRSRWRLVGNAVTVGVAGWLGERLHQQTTYDAAHDNEFHDGNKWPTAAWGASGQRYVADVSMWPERRPYSDITSVVDTGHAAPLSARAATGFLERAGRSGLHFDPDFLVDLKEHVEAMTLSNGRR